MAIKLGVPKGKVVIGAGGSGASSLPIYSGEYEVTPKIEEDIILNTSGYAMANDVLVKEIPYYKVKNSAGGTTFTIG